MQEPSTETTSLTGKRRLTPMLQQYVNAKKECPEDAILLFRMGDFYELFFEDATVAARILDITLTAREKGADAIPMAGFPHHSVSSYVARLVQNGYSVAICDQVEDPKKAKGLVKREITQLITPGTVSDLEALDPGAANYLACLQPETDGRYTIAFLDLLAGELLWTTVPESSVTDELRRMGAREILVDDAAEERFGTPLKARALAVRSLPDDALLEDDALEAMQQRFGQRWFKDIASQLTPRVALTMERLIRFAESTQRRKLVHLMSPRSYLIADYLVLDEATQSNLELCRTQRENRRQGSLLWHLNACRTSIGSRTLAHWLLFPLRDAERINRRLDAVEALKQNRPLREEVQRALDPVRDIERLVGRVAMARATPRDLGALRASLSQVPLLRAPLENHESPLGIRWRNADLIPELHTLLSTALQDDPPTSFQEGGIFAKGYRDDLDKLIAASEGGHQFLVDLEQREREKTGIPKLKVRFNKVFGYFIEVSRAQSHLVPDSYIRKQTLVNAERYITEELKEFESTVLNADALRKEREYELFHELVTEVAAETDRLRAVSRLVAETDAIGSLAQIADQWRYVRPELTNEPVLELSESRHPVIERVIPGGEQFVPNSMSLRRDGTRLAIITGPNMGGKSTVMRQAALTAIMAHMGSFVPASKARVGLLDRVFTRVGASDDLSRGISTFMAEMIETATILREATDSSLVILDEIGRGTSTYDGISIAWAVAEYLHNQSQSLTMFATHYHELTTLAEREKTITNWSVAVRQKGEQIVFLRQLEEGPANRSYGIQVAGLAGLPSDVQKRASELLGMLEAERENTQSPQQHAPKKSGLPQLSLFDAPVKPASTPPQPPEGRALTSALKQLKIEQLTPIQALLELDRLKHLIKDSSQEVH